jgi:hypothetical protein
MSRVWRTVLMLALVTTGTACRRSASPGPGSPPGTNAASVQSPLPSGPTDRRLLDTLPPSALFRWADPRSVFSGLSESDVERAMSFDAHEQRRFLVAVLDASGWRAVPDSAEFELVAAKSTRTLWRNVSTPDPRNEGYVDPCIGQLPQHCRRPPRVVYPPRVTRESTTELRQLFAVVRLRDGATRWWIVQGENPGDVPVALLRMLRNGQDY